MNYEETIEQLEKAANFGQTQEHYKSIIDAITLLQHHREVLLEIQRVYETIDLNACVMAPRKLNELTDAIYAIKTLEGPE